MNYLPKVKNGTTDPRDLPIRLAFVDKDYSRYTLFPFLFKFSKVFLGLENKISCHLKINSRSDKYPIPKIANMTVNLICCGVDRFTRLDDEFSAETGLAKCLGLEKGFPSANTVYRFFRKFTGYNLRQLQKINMLLLSENKSLWLPDNKTIFVDVDMNVKTGLTHHSYRLQDQPH